MLSMLPKRSKWLICSLPGALNDAAERFLFHPGHKEEHPRPTFKSSHTANFLTPSPASLKPSRTSSNRSDILSLTLSVSRFVPRSSICCRNLEMEDVRPNSFTERFSAVASKAGEESVSGSSRYCGGWASRAEA